LGGGVVAELGDGDAMDRGVDLAVACTRQAVGVGVAGPGWQGGCSVVTGEGVLALEGTNVGDLGDELGGG
jgi:hypothetical protein